MFWNCRPGPVALSCVSFHHVGVDLSDGVLKLSDVFGLLVCGQEARGKRRRQDAGRRRQEEAEEAQENAWKPTL